jgi:nitrate/nitrite transporter NarK
MIGILMDRFGPRVVIPLGAVLVSAGMILATFMTQPWHLDLTMGVLVGGGTIFLSYMGHSLFLPYWFVRRRGLALGIAFAGVGIGSIMLFPWLQGLINRVSWREACWTMAVLLFVTVVPLNILLQRRRPEDLGLAPDGDQTASPARHAQKQAYLMVTAQGFLGYGMSAVYSALPLELFQGKQYGAIAGMLSVASSLGAGLGPWVTGALYDRTGSYTQAFEIGVILSLVSIICIWLAAPRKVRVVAGQVARLQAQQRSQRQEQTA